MSNPFASKLRKQQQINPFAAKAKSQRKPALVKEQGGSNPFVARAKDSKAERIAQLEQLMREAEQAYDESLAKAMKGGINKEQINKLFNISDRRMTTLMNLSRLHRSLIEGKGRNGSWAGGSSSKTKAKKRKQAKKSNSNGAATTSTPKKKSSAAKPFKKPAATTRKDTGTAPRIRLRK